MSQGYTPNLEVPINILLSGLLVVLLLVCGAGLSAQQNTGSGDLPTGIPGPLPPIPPAVINQAGEAGVTVRAVRVTEAMDTDGVLDEAFYQETQAITEFIQSIPDAGAEPTEPVSYTHLTLPTILLV